MTRAVWVNLGERVLFEGFLPAFVGVLLAVHGLSPAEGAGSIPWLSALDQGAFAAVIALVSGLLAIHLPALTAPGLDLLYRGVTAFLSSILAALTVSGIAPSLLHFDWSHAAYVAAIAAIGAVGKALVGVVTDTHGAAVFSGAQRRRATYRAHARI